MQGAHRVTPPCPLFTALQPPACKQVEALAQLSLDKAQLMAEMQAHVVAAATAGAHVEQLKAQLVVGARTPIAAHVHAVVLRGCAAATELEGGLHTSWVGVLAEHQPPLTH